MNRRDFVKSALAAPMMGVAGVSHAASAERRVGDNAPSQGSKHPLAGKKLPAWKPGEFQIHFIYTGVAESMFWIMPDGTTMLLDCGDHGRKLDIDKGRSCYYGYDYGGRLIGLSELRGLEAGIKFYSNPKTERINKP